jgi:hypothetical protein
VFGVGELPSFGKSRNAETIAVDESRRATKLYDRTSDEITLDEITQDKIEWS